MLPEEKARHLDPATTSRSPAILKISELAHGIDILEESVRTLDRELLNILLYDQTTKTDILWATTDYVSYGPEFGELCKITPELVTGEYATLIQPRITKSQSSQVSRTRDKAEVFTPSWICNKQNNLIDQRWFGRENVFNIENGNTWTTTADAISFKGCKKGWQKYDDSDDANTIKKLNRYLFAHYKIKYKIIETENVKKIRPLIRRARHGFIAHNLMEDSGRILQIQDLLNALEDIRVYFNDLSIEALDYRVSALTDAQVYSLSFYEKMGLDLMLQG